MKQLLLILFVCISLITNATTYYISTTGNDNTGNGTIGNPWKTLFKATSTVNTSGDIIHVTSGTYTETQQSNLAEGVSIDGDGSATTIIKSAITGQWSVLLQLESFTNANGNQSISNITFNGQYVSEANYKTYIGIWVIKRSNVIIHDCSIINFYNRGVVFDGNGVQNPLTDPGNYTTGNKFYNNSILNSATNTGQYGAGLLNIGGQLGMEIYNNTLIQDQRVNFKNGWPIKYWENGWLKGCKIYNNTLKKAYYQGTYPGENGDWDFAIELFNFQGLEIYNNAIQGSVDLNYNYKGSYAFSAWIHHNTLDHPTVNTHFESGIIFEFATQSAIVEDNVINNASSCISFNTRGPGNSGGYNYPAPSGGYSALTDNIIRRNLFSNVYQPTGCCGGVGITVISEGTDDPYINNMYIYNNTIVAKSGNAPYVGIDLSSQANGNTNNIFIRNNIVNNFNSAWIQGTSGAGNTNITGMTLTHNNTFGNGNGNVPSWPGGNPTSYTYNNNMSVNPLFISGTDFHLQGTSTLIDAGINVGLPYNGSAPDMGCYETGTVSNNPPVASFTSSTIKCVNTSISFTDQSSNTPTSWLWSFPGATINSSTSQNPSATYSVSGTYSVTLISANASGTSTPVTQTISVSGMPSVTSTSANVCSGTTATLTASGASTYTWLLGSSTGTTFTAAPTNNTTYSVTGTSTVGCSKTITTTITIKTLPSVTSTSANVCLGTTATLTASGASTYTWLPGSFTGTTFTAAPTTNTTYSVTGTSTLGCVKTITTSIKIKALPNVGSTSANICIGGTATLTANGASTYTWLPGSLTGTTFTAMPTNTTTYSVTGTSSLGCVKTITTAINVNALPSVTLTPISGPLCTNSPTVALSGNPSGGIYSGTGVNGSNFNPTIAGAGTFTISYLYTDGNNCSNTDSKIVNVSLCTSIDESKSSTISIYPNPANDIIIVELLRIPNNESTIEIYDVFGKLIISEKIINQINLIKINSLTKGVYTLHINSDKNLYIKKIVKE